MKVSCLLGSLSRGGTETLLLDVFRNADKADFEFIGVQGMMVRIRMISMLLNRYLLSAGLRVCVL